MAGGVEQELKLAVSADDAHALLGQDWVRAAGPAVTSLAARYFDTARGTLRKAGYTLRVRDEDGTLIQTVKAAGEAAGLFARPEWACALTDDAPRLDAAAGPVESLLADGEPLAVVFTTEIERTGARIASDDGTVELAIDRGCIVAGGERHAVCEVELELVEGNAAAIFALARRVAATTPVRIGVESKSERGYRLAAGHTARAVKAGPVALGGHVTAAAAFGDIAHECLRQFRLNEDRLLAHGDAASLHQARVGLRRLRSAFSLFRPLFKGDDRADMLRAELRWLQSVLGEARDIDVLIARLGKGHAARARLKQARARAYQAATDALGSTRTRALMLDLVEWLALGRWRKSRRVGEPVLDAAATILDRQFKRLLAGGETLTALDNHDRHKVRIEAKKLRYATEFFAALYTGKKRRTRHHAFLSALEALQERLGALNDLATAPALTERLGVATDVVEQPDTAGLLDDADQAFGALMKAKRFWR